MIIEKTKYYLFNILWKSDGALFRRSEREQIKKMDNIGNDKKTKQLNDILEKIENITDVEEKKRQLNDFYNNLSEICNGNYKKYVETIEQLEKDGKLKTSYIAREQIKTIWG